MAVARMTNCLWLFCTLMLSSELHALTIHYDLSRNEALKTCDEALYSGEKQASVNCYQRVFNTSEGLVQADAAAALGDVQTANRLYRDLAASDTDPAIKTNWGLLYLETHQVSDAEALFREALLYNDAFLPAQIGLAKALSEGFEGRARQLLVDITTQYPDNVQAMVLRARIELELQNLDTARGLLNRALSVIPEQGLPPLEIYALHAGADLLDGKSIQPWIDKALEINPQYGDVYAIPAHFYIITYRYREAVELYQAAVNIDPDLATAHRDLGINLLRINNIFAARYHLLKAFSIDAFDAKTVNTLRLLDGIDDMRISTVDVGAADDPETIIGRVLIRLDRDDADALEPYVVDLATRAVQVFTERYDFQLQRPMVVELYHDHDDFGVRTVSTPGIGLLGVTFGYLTAMDSPKARASGDFHWGSTLWHEIAHVFTLEATNHRLPRWFSEGLSVYEEWNTGPLPNRELPVDTLTAFSAGQFLPVAELDNGFVRPSYQGQVQVSYMQAGLICDFISARWGHQALVSMLKSFADGDSTEEALQEAIGLDADGFDMAFRESMQAQYGELSASLDSYRVAVQQLVQARELRDWISVEALARDLVRRYPERVTGGNGYEVLAEAQRAQGDEDSALDTLLEWHARGGHDPDTLQGLAADLTAAGRGDEAIAVLESLNWVMPYVSDEHAQLGNHYLANGDAQRAIREFDALLAMREDDPAQAYLGKARAAMLLDDPSLARRQVLNALENAPFYRPAQKLLLELTGDNRD